MMLHKTNPGSPSSISEKVGDFEAKNRRKVGNSPDAQHRRAFHDGCDRERRGVPCHRAQTLPEAKQPGHEALPGEREHFRSVIELCIEKVSDVGRCVE
eukprot:6201565-Pleurochrysis_carterae.AAC.1